MLYALLAASLALTAALVSMGRRQKRAQQWMLTADGLLDAVEEEAPPVAAKVGIFGPATVYQWETRRALQGGEDLPHQRVASLLLMQHVDDERVRALARRYLASEDAALQVRAAICVEDPAPLMRALNSSGLEAAHRSAAVVALSRLSPGLARVIARGGLEGYDEAAVVALLEVLAPPHLEPGDAQRLLRIAQRRRGEARALALKRLEQLGPGAADALLSMVHSDELELAERGLRLLVALDDPRVLPLLRQGLQLGSLEDRLFSVSWLGRLGSLEDVEALMPLREHDPSPQIRGAAAEAIEVLQAAAPGERGGISLTGDRDAGSLSLADDRSGGLSVVAGGDVEGE
jgi:hypothetical protein